MTIQVEILLAITYCSLELPIPSKREDNLLQAYWVRVPAGTPFL
jgi:hypothetical protein